MLQVEAVQARVQAQFEVGLARPPVPEPHQLVVSARARLREPLDVDPDDAPAHDRWQALPGPAPPAVQARVQVVPGTEADLAVAGVFDGHVGVGYGGGPVVGELEALAVAPWPSRLAGGTRVGDRVGEATG